MPPRKQVPKKTKKPFKVDMTTLSTDAKLHLIVWDAYTKAGFFAKLLECRDNAENLAQVLKAYALTGDELALVQGGLQPDSVLVDPQHVMEGLRMYTRPKWTREKLAKDLASGAMKIWVAWTGAK
jgi:hypothetical protein